MKRKHIDFQIAFVIPNITICETTRRVLAEHGYAHPVYHADQEKALLVARYLEQRGSKIIISTGLTAKYLQMNCQALVYEMQCGEIELYNAVMEAFRYTDKVATISAPSMDHAMQRVIETFELPVDNFVLSLDEPFAVQAERVLDLGYEVLISGTPSVLAARHRGKHGISPDLDAKVVEITLDLCTYMCGLLTDAERKYQTLNALLDCVSESIIGTDGAEHITFLNPAAERLIGAPEEGLLGRKLSEVLQEHKLRDIMQIGDNKFLRQDERGVILNAVAVRNGEETIGKVITVKEIGEISRLEHSIRKELLNRGHFAKNTFNQIIGASPALQRTKSIAQKYAAANGAVLILGETGTGKELFAQSIHNASRRAHEAFVAVNCAALPENLLESELFGYVKGAFSGARGEGKTGLFELAHNGTIFLDEISEISVSMQAKLLRVLQEKEIRRVGDDKVIPIDVRIIAASNQSLEQLVADGSFREDLYYRLSVLVLHLPSLNERVEDIRPICENLIGKKNIELGTNIHGMTPQFVRALEQMRWQGNIRQLINVIERLMILSEESILTERLLQEHISPNLRPAALGAGSLESLERQSILATLQKTAGNKTEAARLLGIHPSTLWRKLKAYQIEQNH